MSEGDRDGSVSELWGRTFSLVDIERLRERDRLIRRSLFGPLLLRARSFAAVENGKVRDVGCVCLMECWAERNAELPDNMVEFGRANVRDLRAVKSFIVIQYRLYEVDKSPSSHSPKACIRLAYRRDRIPD